MAEDVEKSQSDLRSGSSALQPGVGAGLDSNAVRKVGGDFVTLCGDFERPAPRGVAAAV